MALGFRCYELNYIINSKTKIHVPGIYITYRVYFLVIHILCFKQHFLKSFKRKSRRLFHIYTIGEVFKTFNDCDVCVDYDVHVCIALHHFCPPGVTL